MNASANISRTSHFTGWRGRGAVCPIPPCDHSVSV